MSDNHVELDESGLSLPLNLGTERNEPAPPDVTEQDRAQLAELDAELNQRWSEDNIDPTLDRMRYLMDLLGNPQKSFPSIHVAGTNGKTSTTRMIESLLRAFHRRTGRTISPHLQDVTERIAIDGAPIHPRDFIRIYNEIKTYIDMTDQWSVAAGGPKMSKFEVLTAVAYAAFADAPVDVAVVEVGMGGSWDATNVIDSEVAVITPIGMDHTDRLGDTLVQIAGEKAGIIKPKPAQDDVLAPTENIAVIGYQEPEAMHVVLERAAETETVVARQGTEFGVTSSTVAVGGQQLELRGLGGDYPDIFLPLSGIHQAENAATALAAVEAFFGAGAGRPLALDTVREGFAQVQSPGRLEKVKTSPATFLDIAHNPHGATALATALTRDFSFSRLIGVVAMLGDKDVAGFLTTLEPILDEIVYTQNHSPRALDAYELAEYAREIYGDERVHVTENIPDAIELATELAEDTDVQSGAGVIITGSAVTVGEARTLFGRQPA